MALPFLVLLLAGLASGTAAAPGARSLQSLSALLARLQGGGKASVTGVTCPPPGFNSVDDFNASRYISAPWYVQEQMPLAYQPVDQLFCVRATYVPFNPSDPLAGLEVRNYANRGGVNGEAVGTSGGGMPGRLVAQVPDRARPSKLEVGFALMGSTRPLGAGPYWVVAVDPDYQWAIVTGGAPEEAAPGGGCMTGATGGGRQVNDVGFWLFSRKPVDPEGTAIMRAKAVALGLDLSPLVKVAQEGCKYAGA